VRRAAPSDALPEIGGRREPVAERAIWICPADRRVFLFGLVVGVAHGCLDCRGDRHTTGLWDVERLGILERDPLGVIRRVRLDEAPTLGEPEEAVQKAGDLCAVRGDRWPARSSRRKSSTSVIVSVRSSRSFHEWPTTVHDDAYGRHAAEQTPMA
jgi:hypothetical protein